MAGLIFLTPQLNRGTSCLSIDKPIIIMKKIFLGAIFLSLLISCDKEEDCKKSERCDLVPDPGLCQAYITKYYFDKTDGKCKEFIWGGCNGVVPFDTVEECKQCGCSHK